MKKIALIAIMLCFVISVFGQAPHKMTYQAVVRDANNSLVINQTVGIQISILKGTTNGEVVHLERQTPTTNINGLISIIIGVEGSIALARVNPDTKTASIAAIDWGADIYFIKTELDPTGGTDYTITGITQLLSVPYALHAKTAGSITQIKLNDLSDGKSDSNGTNNGSSVFLGKDTGLNDDSTDNKNVGIGFEVLKFNNTGSGNTASGNRSLFLNESGHVNMASGMWALYFNKSGSYNTASGSQALYENTIGMENTASGFQALLSNTTGSGNTANGLGSLYNNKEGSFNTALGLQSLYYNNFGSNATAIGYKSMYYANSSITAFINYNVALGYEALRGSEAPSDNIGNKNIALGYQSLFNNTSGNNNTTNGYQSLFNNTSGSNNVAIGYDAGKYTNGNRNVFLGYDTGAGGGQDTKEGSVFIGARAGFHENKSNRLYIENSTSKSPLIYGEFENDILRINGEFQIGDPVTTGYRLPITDGTVNQVLVSNGNGIID